MKIVRLNDIDFKGSGNNSVEQRNSLRKLIVDLFGKEEPGTGRGEKTSKYEYIFDDIYYKGDKYNIFIDRPANLHNGYDFLISLKKNEIPVNFSEGKFLKDGKKKRKTASPGFDDIYEDLKLKKQENENKFNQVIPIIGMIYRCEDVNIKEYSKNIHFESGLPIEVILKLIKWLFIEQDIRYWNYSGRATFLEYLKNLI